ncbi:hypothetical protein FQR65_LT15332 [Abscondita terminalis]|nr:hypothetical protein FQR65_LT15332 [Abscondita terminalis]
MKNFNLENLVRPNILKLKPYSSARDEYKGSTVYFLDANENPFGNLNRYPDPYQKEVKEKLSALKSIPVSQIFLDRDGTLVLEPEDYQVDSFTKLEFYPEVFQYLSKIAKELDYELVMVTNQDGLGT